MCLTCNSPQGVISTHLNEKEPGAAVLQGAGEWASHGALCRPSGGDNGRRLKPGGGSLPVNSAYTHPHTLSYLHTHTCTNTCTRTYLARPSSARSLENVKTLWAYLPFFFFKPFDIMFHTLYEVKTKWFRDSKEAEIPILSVTSKITVKKVKRGRWCKIIGWRHQIRVFSEVLGVSKVGAVAHASVQVRGSLCLWLTPGHGSSLLGRRQLLC